MQSNEPPEEASAVFDAIDLEEENQNLRIIIRYLAKNARHEVKQTLLELADQMGMKEADLQELLS